MIQWMLAIWSLVPAFSQSRLYIWKFLIHLLLKPSLKDSEYCQHLKWVQLCGCLNILWHCPSLGLKWKLTFSSPAATAEFSKFVGILSEALWCLGASTSSVFHGFYEATDLFLIGFASQVPQTVKNLTAVQETLVWFLGWENSLEEEMATHSSILAWEIQWTGEPGGQQSMESQRVRHNRATNTLQALGV